MNNNKKSMIKCFDHLIDRKSHDVDSAVVSDPGADAVVVHFAHLNYLHRNNANIGECILSFNGSDLS